jgi:hypothetical protein
MTISPPVLQQAVEAAAADARHSHFFTMLNRIVLPDLSTSIKRFALTEAATDLAITAVGLERFRLANGNYPETLDDLSPKFLKRVPLDVINGGPLHYRLNSDGRFTLYSVGWNEKDDGGKFATQKGTQRGTVGLDYEKGDWVWCYPIKP